MRSWLVHLMVVALMALCAGSAVAGPSATHADLRATGWLAAEASDPAVAHAPAAAGSLDLSSSTAGELPPKPSSPLPLFDPAPLDSAADVPALVDGPRPFPLPELQAAAPRRLIGAPPPLPFLEGLRRPPRSAAVLG